MCVVTAVAFMHACALGKLALVELLISSKCDTSIKVCASGTNLAVPGTDSFTGSVTGWDLAIHNGRLDVVELLLSRKADPLRRDIDGLTPGEIARLQGDQKWVSRTPRQISSPAPRVHQLSITLDLRSTTRLSA